MIELLVALSVIVVGVIGVFSLMTQSLGLTRVVADRYIANYLGVEGIEVVKNLADRNAIQGDWTSGLTEGEYEVSYDSSNLPLPPYNPNRFLTMSPIGIYSYDTSPENRQTSFRRKVTIRYPDCPAEPRCLDRMQVNSIIAWTSRGGAEFELNLEDHLFRWR